MPVLQVMGLTLCHDGMELTNHLTNACKQTMVLLAPKDEFLSPVLMNFYVMTCQ